MNPTAVGTGASSSIPTGRRHFQPPIVALFLEKMFHVMNTLLKGDEWAMILEWGDS
jgi:hypothetical protein